MINREEINNMINNQVKLNNLDNCTEEEKEEAILNYELSCYTPFYNDLVDGLIYDSEDIFNTFQFYIRIKEEEKVVYCAFLLNKYYSGYLNEKMNELITNEEYELCEKIKTYVN